MITTSYLALVEGDIPVQAGDDAADALWFKINLMKEYKTFREEDCCNENESEIWNLNLLNESRGIHVGAKVEITHSGHRLLDKKQYYMIENDGLAADHGCLITHALLYLKEKLEHQ